MMNKLLAELVVLSVLFTIGHTATVSVEPDDLVRPLAYAWQYKGHCAKQKGIAAEQLIKAGRRLFGGRQSP